MAQQDNQGDSGELDEAYVTQNPSEMSATQVQVPASQPPPVLEKHKAPEITTSRQDELGTRASTNGKSANIEALEPFGWDDFQSRYDHAMEEANKNQMVLSEDFDELMGYFSVWAGASSEFDEDRAMKRLKTRQTFIQGAENSLEEKRNHYTQVVEAFKKALALLAV